MWPAMRNPQIICPPPLSSPDLGDNHPALPQPAVSIFPNTVLGPPPHHTASILPRGARAGPDIRPSRGCLLLAGFPGTPAKVETGDIRAGDGWDQKVHTKNSGGRDGVGPPFPFRTVYPPPLQPGRGEPPRPREIGTIPALSSISSPSLSITRGCNSGSLPFPQWRCFQRSRAARHVPPLVNLDQPSRTQLLVCSLAGRSAHLD